MTLREKQNTCLVCNSLFTPAHRHPNQKYCSEHVYSYKRSETSLQKRRERYATDPQYREVQINRAREHKLKVVYNITEQTYSELLEKQVGCCAICGESVSSKSAKFGKKRLAVDHCHNTGEVRGLLCTNCNVSLGGFKDNIDLLLRAIKYLEKANG